MNIKRIVPLLILAVALALAASACKNDGDGGKNNNTPVAVTGVTLSPKTVSVGIGESATLAAAVAPSNATNQSLAWSVDKPAIATVENGVVKGIALGGATVTVTTADGAKTDTCAVTVTEVVPVTGVALSRAALTLEVGSAVTLRATVSPTNASNKSVTWSTSNPAVASVSGGSVKALGVGTASITAKSEADPTKLSSCQISVVNEDAVSPNIVLSGGKITVTWEAVADAVSYDVYRAGSRLGEKTKLAAIDKLTYTDESPNPVKYENYYTVVPKDAAGNTIIGLKWNFIDGAVNYRVERAATPSGTFAPLGTVSADGERSFIDKAPNYAFGQTTYRIDPLDQAGDVMKGGFDTDSPTHTVTASNVRAYSVTRNIVLKEFYPEVISFERLLFGENVYFYDAKHDSMPAILKDVNRIADAMRSSAGVVQMSYERFSLYFKPGNYPFGTLESGQEYPDTRGARLDVGFYTTLAGLGLLPTQTRIGATVYTPPALAHTNNGGSNATHNFWRSIENFEVYRPQGMASTPRLNWAVSQAAPMRRISTASGISTDYNANGGWGSGGFTGDCRFGGGVGAGGQQQWYTRNSHFGSGAMSGIAWNNFCIASTGSKFSNSYLTGGTGTFVDSPIKQMREKPFLYYDTTVNDYKVFVPGLRQNASGVSWSDISPGPGESYDISEFYMAKPGDSASKINSRLAGGKHLFLRPGMYECEEPIFVGEENAVVIGTGMPSLYPVEDNGEGVMLVSDVSGVTLAGFVVDAYGDTKYLLRVGEPGSNKNHAQNPTFISDVFARVGGFPSVAVNAEVSVDIHSNDVIGDHFWIWLADHGRFTGWARNTGAFGLIVHGDRVTMHGLFVEHYQKYQTLWLGNYGETFFYQNELPYTVPSQEAWMAQDGAKGWSAFKVANTVDNFHGIGFGSYSTIRLSGGNILLNNAYEAPNKPGVKLEALYANNISDGTNGFVNMINDYGGRVNGQGYRLASFDNGQVKRQGSSAPAPATNPKDQDYAKLIEKIF
ncbi:MAG: Ig-like domain-containing protein [Firmicutes bacterium]|nr:Ig-like domain-containing protein [Bacillota bacterium]